MKVFESKNDHKKNWQSQEVWIRDDPSCYGYGESLEEALEDIREKIRDEIKELQKLLKRPVHYAVFSNGLGSTKEHGKQKSEVLKTYKEALDWIPNGSTSLETSGGHCLTCKYNQDSCYCDTMEIKITKL